MEFRKYNYPKINLYYPSRIHPDYDKIYEEVSKWAVQFNLLSSDEKKYHREQFVKVTCLCYPDGDYDRLLLINKWMLHTFEVDDFMEVNLNCIFFDSLRNHGNENKDVISLMDKCFEYEKTPLVSSFANLWKQIKSFTNKTWQKRFAENYIWYLKANEWEQKIIATNRIPSVAEYLEYRHYTGGMDPFLNLIELAQNIFIPDSVMANVTLQRFCFLIGNICVYINDIYSCEKEASLGQITNLVIVMKHEYNISFQEAIYKATALVNDEIKKLLIVQQLIPIFDEDTNECVQKYVEGCKAWITGSHNWGFQSARYNKAEYGK